MPVWTTGIAMTATIILNIQASGATTSLTAAERNVRSHTHVKTCGNLILLV